MTEFITKDSGIREEYDSGMKRDTEAGKARFDLILPEGVPYDEQILTRFAMLLSRGAEKYDARNWEQGDSEAEVVRAKSSAFRHFVQWITGERDEDHAVAVMFNLMVVETIERKMALASALPVTDETQEWSTGVAKIAIHNHFTEERTSQEVLDRNARQYIQHRGDIRGF